MEVDRAKLIVVGRVRGPLSSKLKNDALLAELVWDPGTHHIHA